MDLSRLLEFYYCCGHPKKKKKKGREHLNRLLSYVRSNRQLGADLKKVELDYQACYFIRGRRKGNYLHLQVIKLLNYLSNTLINYLESANLFLSFLVFCLLMYVVFLI